MAVLSTFYAVAVSLGTRSLRATRVGSRGGGGSLQTAGAGIKQHCQRMIRAVKTKNDDVAGTAFSFPSQGGDM